MIGAEFEKPLKAWIGLITPAARSAITADRMDVAGDAIPRAMTTNIAIATQRVNHACQLM